MIVMADPVSISASCGVLLHKTLTKIGVNVVVMLLLILLMTFELHRDRRHHPTPLIEKMLLRTIT